MFEVARESWNRGMKVLGIDSFEESQR